MIYLKSCILFSILIEPKILASGNFLASIPAPKSSKDSFKERRGATDEGLLNLFLASLFCVSIEVSILFIICSFMQTQSQMILLTLTSYYRIWRGY